MSLFKVVLFQTGEKLKSKSLEGKDYMEGFTDGERISGCIFDLFYIRWISFMDLVRRSSMRKCFPFILVLMFLVGCGSTQLPLLNLGVNVSQKYLTLRSEYVETYKESSPELQEYMDSKIVPELNKAREAILEYNDKVLRGTDPGQQREVIIKLLVEISRMMEVL